MASLSSDPNGNRCVQFVASGGKRKSIRLGQVSLRDARTVQGHIEHLMAAKRTGGSVSPGTSEWLDTIDATLRGRLEATGLIQAREALALGALVERWLERRSKTLRPGTVIRLQQGKRSLLAHFGADRDLNTISEGQVEDYRASLLAEGLAEATVRKRCSDARVWFRYALRHGYVRSNPFEAVPTSAVATAYLRYISEADARRVLDKIGDADLRLVFVLARWGGLRIVSEPKALTWDCVDWERSRLTVRSPKTDRHAGHEQRVIPLFPEVVEELHRAFDRAEPGQAHVLPVLHRVQSAALRKPMLKAINAAGLTHWPRLWHNLRSSRQTDLEQRFPSHVVCAWLGNSTTIARKHYLQVLDSDYDRALQNPVQQVRAEGRSEAHDTQGEPDKTAFCASGAGCAHPYIIRQNDPMTPTGFEPVFSA